MNVQRMVPRRSLARTCRSHPYPVSCAALPDCGACLHPSSSSMEIDVVSSNNQHEGDNMTKKAQQQHTARRRFLWLI